MSRSSVSDSLDSTTTFLTKVGNLTCVYLPLSLKINKGPLSFVSTSETETWDNSKPSRPLSLFSGFNSCSLLSTAPKTGAIICGRSGFDNSTPACCCTNAFSHTDPRQLLKTSTFTNTVHLYASWATYCCVFPWIIVASSCTKDMMTGKARRFTVFLITASSLCCRTLRSIAWSLLCSPCTSNWATLFAWGT